MKLFLFIVAVAVLVFAGGFALGWLSRGKNQKIAGKVDSVIDTTKH